MSFPAKVKEDALVASGRHCCICHRFCGIKMEVHHIRPKSKKGPDTLSNAIALCFDCHADMVSYDKDHPKGTKYTEAELTRHRDNWHARIKGDTGLATNQEIVETDKQVYLLLTKLLPWKGSIRFIRENNFAGHSFELERLDDLHAVYRQCDNPAFEFIEPVLEGLRLELLKHIVEFQKTIGFETYPTHVSGRNSVPMEWELEQPKRFREVVEKLHTEADRICKIYDNLVRTATRKLGVLPIKEIEKAEGHISPGVSD
jgi:hypothetical protein